MTTEPYDDSDVVITSKPAAATTELGVAPRKTAPTEPLGYKAGEHQSFRVWADNATYLEDPLSWKCLAAFQYLQEALDYIAYCQDRGGDVVFQSPADCTAVKATDRRAVAK
jgi:hypothetical protein